MGGKGEEKTNETKHKKKLVGEKDIKAARKLCARAGTLGGTTLCSIF